MKELLADLANLDPGIIYLAVAIAAFAESIALTCLLAPGESTVLLGAAAASRSGGSALLVAAAASGGALLGESVSYVLGRHAGPALRNSRLTRLVGARRWAKAERYLAMHGGRAVVIGRYLAGAQALLPMLAGVAGMPYKRFVFASALGVVGWSSLYAGLGVLGERSAGVAELNTAGMISLAALVGIVVLAGLHRARRRWRRNEPSGEFGRRLHAGPPTVTHSGLMHSVLKTDTERKAV